jgi:L-fuconolactonase
MSGIDSHQHFWEYHPQEYPWIKSDWPIRRSFGPADLKPLLESVGLDGCVGVQARQTIAETQWLLDLAREHPFIKGVVGWVDLQSPEVSEQVGQFSANEKFVGVRHVVQDEPDDRFMLREAFLRGISELRQFGLAYDLLVFPKQLPSAIELAGKFPEQRFVLDHLAKPLIRDQVLEPWRSQLRALAKFPNVYCKLSGMVTEAKWRQWRSADFQPYLETAWEYFGEDRLMIGSDWPVCLLSGDYKETMAIALDFLKQFNDETRNKVLCTNTVQFYQLK